nr:TIGR03435 family protein [Terriglobus sp. TAA 43]
MEHLASGNIVYTSWKGLVLIELKKSLRPRILRDVPAKSLQFAGMIFQSIAFTAIGLASVLAALDGGLYMQGQTSSSSSAPQRVDPEQTLTPSFEIASVRVNHSEDLRGDHVDIFSRLPGGRFVATNCALKVLIGYAFHAQWYVIEGIPQKLRSQHFDINAKADGARPLDQYAGMVQRLLEERFSLRAHWETRKAPVMYLVLDKPGKLQPAKYGDCPKGPFIPGAPRPGPPTDASCGGLNSDPGNTKGYSLTTGDLADSLSWFAQKTIIDRTGLTGKYDVKLRWAPQFDEIQPDGPFQPDAPSLQTH